jgi:hypothetical protein
MIARPSQRFWRDNRVTCVAFVLAFVALGLAVFPDAMLAPPPKAPSGMLDLMRSVLSGKKDPATLAFEARVRALHVASLGLGLAAAMLALIGVVRRENRILALSALGVAGLGLVWQYVGIGIVVAIVIVVLAGLTT